MRWWELFRQAAVGVARARLRSALTSLGIAIGCGALVSMVAFALGLQRQLETPLKQLGMLNDIHVSPRQPSRSPEAGETSKADQAPSTPLDGNRLAEFRAIPGVMYAYPDMSLHDVKVVHGAASMSVNAMALPRELAMSDAMGELIVSGNFFSLDNAAEIVISESVAEELKFEPPAEAVGQTLDASAAGLAATAQTGKFQFQTKTLPLRIVGVFRPPDFGGLSPRGVKRSVLLPIDVMQQLPGVVESQLGNLRREGVAALDSFTGATVRAEKVSEVPRIAKQIADEGFRVHTVLSQMEDMRIAFLFIESLLTAVGTVALVIAGLGIANTLLMAVLERYSEIGLYKALGATDGDVRILFLSEAAILGLAGSLGGLLLAGGVCWGLQLGVNAYLTHQGVKRAVDVFYFPWQLLASAVAFSIALSILSGIYPASRASRVDPIQALRRI